MNVIIEMDDRDFWSLCHTSCLWALGADSWTTQPGRFEPHAPGQRAHPDYVPDLKWDVAYWIEADASVLLARAYLKAQGHDYDIVVDTRDDIASWVILTDYRAPLD